MSSSTWQRRNTSAQHAAAARTAATAAGSGEAPSERSAAVISSTETPGTETVILRILWALEEDEGCPDAAPAPAVEAGPSPGRRCPAATIAAFKFAFGCGPPPSA